MTEPDTPQAAPLPEPAPDQVPEFSAAQRRAVEHEGGPLIVVAGPGSGKTSVLIGRAADMINRRGADPSSILMVTFTIRAAEQLRRRLAGPGGVGRDRAELVQATTFNALGMRLITRFADLAGLPPRLSLIDHAQQTRMMRSLAIEHGLFRHAAAGGIPAALEQAWRRITRMRSAGYDPLAAARRLDRHAERLDAIEHPDDVTRGRIAELVGWREAVRLWRLMRDACRERGLISYDDQVPRAVELLRASPQARDIIRGECRHLLVDEYQDVNRHQADLLETIAPPERRPDICAVGDDDQSIYGFRGADDLAMDHFERTWRGPGGEPVARVVLDECWRCSPPVIRAANAIIERAHHRYSNKVIRAPEGAQAQGPPPATIIKLQNYKRDAEVIVALIPSDLTGHLTGDLKGDAPIGHAPRLRDIAVIARHHNDLARVAQALRLAGIPCRLARPPTPLDDQAVQDMVAWFGLVLDPRAAHEALRLLRRPPLTMDPGRLMGHLEAYGRLSRASRPDDVPPFPAWLAERIGPDDPDHPIAARFAALHAGFTAAAADSPANEAAFAIVRDAGLAHADLLEGHARAARVRALVDALRFIQDRLDRLEPPRDLRAFMAYRDDLEARERAFQAGDDRDPESDAADDDTDQDAVTLLTAHAAKGLEFDVVYITRVEDRGFQPRANSDDEPLHQALAPEQPGPRTPKQAAEDEVRRLLYVAMTRAKRGLALLGKVPKSVSNINYPTELIDAKATAVVDDTAILRHAAHDPIARELALSFEVADQRRAALADARREARALAAAALDTADDPALEPPGFERAAEALRLAAARLAAVAAAEHGRPAPTFAQEAAELHAAIAASRPQAPEPPHAHRPYVPPDRFSYSIIDAYLRCPRCYRLTHALRLPEPISPGLHLGIAVHEALRLHAEALRAADAVGLRPPRADPAALARSAIARAWPYPEGPDELVRAQIEAQILSALGSRFDPGRNIILIETPIDFDYPHHSGPVPFRAKLDRVDQQPDGSWLIIDYKTGGSWGKLTDPDPAKDLQLAIYLMALAAHLNTDPDALTGHAEYALLSTGDTGRIDLADLARNLPKTRATIDLAIDGIRAGRFDARGKDSQHGHVCDAFIP